MKKRFLGIYLLAALSLNFVSCEYELTEENFIEIDKPSANHQFDLNLLNEEDTIKVFNVTEFKYNINSYGLDILKGEFIFGSNRYPFTSSTGQFYYYPNQNTFGYDTLTMIVYSNSGSGSIADAAGAEGYVAAKQWLYLQDLRPGPDCNLNYEFTDDGFVKLTWQKCGQYNFKSYLINNNIEITNPNITSYIDKTYCGGNATFSVVANVFTEGSNNHYSYAFIDDSLPNLYFEDWNKDSIRVFWDKASFKCRYSISDNAINIETTDTSVLIKKPPFGDFVNIYLSLKQLNGSLERYCNSLSYYTGSSLNFGIYNFNKVQFNKLENQQYLISDDEIFAVDIRNAKILKRSLFGNTSGGYFPLLATGLNITDVGVIENNRIIIYDNKNLIQKKQISFNNSGYPVKHFFMCDNRKISVATTTEYFVIDMESENIERTITLTGNSVYLNSENIATSHNGKYACIANYEGLKVFNIDLSDTILYQNTLSYTSVLFNTINENQLILALSGSNTIEIHDVDNFNLLKTIELPYHNVILGNIDPKTGWMLVYSSDNLCVIDIETGDILFNQDLAYSRWPLSLYDNLVFTFFNTRYIDISKYLK